MELVGEELARLHVELLLLLYEAVLRWTLLLLLTLIRLRGAAELLDKAENAVLGTVWLRCEVFGLLCCTILLLAVHVDFLAGILCALAHGLDLVVSSILHKVSQLELFVTLFVYDCSTGRYDLRENVHLRLLVLREDGLVQDGTLVRRLLL